MGADCKSVGLCLRRFESYICHTQNPGERQLTGVLSFVGETGPFVGKTGCRARRHGPDRAGDA